ncbi:unnamed protein product [Durusdinium trenchii]|uniref:Peptidase A1 domain-containing protein n=1 Tax=Durusdinium trenchii TaxID=1381693 RepID=A0ABP0JUP7_9DINO
MAHVTLFGPKHWTSNIELARMQRHPVPNFHACSLLSDVWGPLALCEAPRVWTKQRRSARTLRAVEGTRRGRRVVVGSLTGLLVGRTAARRARARTRLSKVKIPLHWEAGGFYLYFTLSGERKSKENQKRIYAVADTGSPFCLVARCLRKDCPSYCAEVGCFEGEGKPSGDPDSWEGYASGVVEIQWRSDGQVSFPEAEESWSMKSIGFGVQGRVIGFGGTGKAVFFGLIRDHQAGMKQSFLEQTPFRFLTIDLRVPGREVLTLDTFGTAGSSADERVRLVDPRRWGDPVKHYCALATLRIGGQVLCAEATRKVLVLVDTGTTGASMTAPLYDAYLLLARENAQRGSSWSSARQIEVVFDDSNVSFQMYVGKHPTYGLGLDLVTPINEMAWAPTSVADKPYEDVMLMGLGFLVGTRIQVDTQRDELIVTRDQKNGKRRGK